MVQLKGKGDEKMDMIFFEGQAVFLEDYKKVAKNQTIDEQQVISEVMDQLNQPTPNDELYYILPGGQTTKGHAVRFPFRKELMATDNEATVSKQYFYQGSPYEYEIYEDEQL